MSRPSDTDMLGKVIQHSRDDKSEKFITRFANVPDIEFLTWLKSSDNELELWVAKPRKWFGTETKTPPFVFIISNYKKGYVSITRVIVNPYSNEIFEQENNLGFSAL